MKISIILTAYKEEETVGRAIKSLCDSNYSGFKGDLELIQVSPDHTTISAGETAFRKLQTVNCKLKTIKDPGKGKPTALNLALEEVTGDIVIFTDGDIHFEEEALSKLVEKFSEDKKIGAVTGRPISSDPKDYMMGYYGHLFADANHYRRQVDLADIHQEKSKLFVKKHKFFPLSGYIMAVRKDLIDFKLPEDTLVDDAYISYKVFNKGYKLAYEPGAIAYIKYPKTLSDYFRQKKRSTGGYIQLWKYGVVKKETKARGSKHELQMFWFPFKYAKSVKEFFWSVLLIPIRIVLWIQILFEQRIMKKDFENSWVRVESTK